MFPYMKVPVVRSVEVVTNPGKMLAVDIDCNPSLRVFGGVVQPVKLNGSRREEQEISEVAIEAWQLLHRLLTERCGDVRPFRFEQRSFCGDINRLGYLAGLEGHIHGRDRVNRHIHIFLNSRFKARNLHTHQVFSDNQVGLAIIAPTR